MKVRSGFVSNSSSTSFVCCITGETEWGYDISYEEATFYCCENGHEFLEEYLQGTDTLIEVYRKAMEDDDQFRSELPEKLCPICSFAYLDKQDVIKYIQTKHNISEDKAYKAMKAENKRLRKIRPNHWLAALEQEKNITYSQLEEEIRNNYNSYKQFKGDL